MIKRYVSFLVAAVVAIGIVGCDRSGPAIVGPATPETAVATLPVVADTIVQLAPTSSAKAIMREDGLTVRVRSLEQGPARYGCRVNSATTGAWNLELTFARRLREGAGNRTAPFVYRFSSVKSRKAAKNWRPKKGRQNTFLAVRCWVPKTEKAMRTTRKLVKAALHKVHSDRVYIYRPGRRPGMSHYMANDDIAGCPEPNEGEGVCQMGGVTITAPRGDGPPDLGDGSIPPPPDTPWSLPGDGDGGGGYGGENQGDQGTSDEPPTRECRLPNNEIVREPLGRTGGTVGLLGGGAYGPDDDHHRRARVPGCSDETVREWRIKQLAKYLKKHPLALLDIPCRAIPTYRRLAQYMAPQDVVNRLKHVASISEVEAYIQSLKGGGTVRVHLDSYGIRVHKSDLPNGMSPRQYYEYWRKNFNSFFDQHVARFRFYPGLQGERQRWLNHPLGTIFSIQLMFARQTWIEDGTVIVSDYDRDSWIFATAWTREDLAHPVSGNREFSYKSLGGGRYWYGTQGAYGVTAGFYGVTNFLTKLLTEDGLVIDGGKRVWNNMLKHLKADLGPGAEVVKREAIRVDKDKLRAVINGRAKLATLGCSM